MLKCSAAKVKVLSIIISRIENLRRDDKDYHQAVPV
uniref:Uncharacterized protein n=1 Tax=Neisseria meningitidis alpha275 TaxID=295996 RepID=C6SII6_NEIME|nr:hypothetical protein predicted by Glimmer/Critica [Neisseria meningitidis alpha275]